MQVLVLVALRAADALERDQVLARLGLVAGQQVGLADVLVRAAVLGLELQRLAIVLEGLVVPVLVPEGVAQPVAQVGVRGFGDKGDVEMVDRTLPVA